MTQTSGTFVKAGSFSYGESRRTPPLEGTSLHRNNSVERPWGILSLFTTCLWYSMRSPSTGCDRDKWHLCKTGSFSYGESPRTPPREGTSLHRRNNSVERPWGILSLFTTCLPFTLPEAVTDMWGVFVKWASPPPSTPYPHSESPQTPPLIKELHSTDETRVWRHPGDLGPV